MKGCVHVYTGNGKGKTTCAVGLLVRALGAGLRCLLVQFVKNAPTGELVSLERLGCPVLRMEGGNCKFTWDMSPQELADYGRCQQRLLERAEAALGSGAYDLVVLDEALGAVHGGFLPLAALDALVDGRPAGVELVLTGRNAPPSLVERADYVTEMQPVKHPMDQGIMARQGIEF